MVDNQHKKITGYRDLTEEEIALMNEAKELASRVGELTDKIKNGKAQGDVVFQKRTSLVFKKLQVVRFYDTKRNTLAYLAYSDKVVEGSPKNALSAVPIMPWH